LTNDSLDGTPGRRLDGDTGSLDFKQEGNEVPPDLKAVGRLDNDKFGNYMVLRKKRVFRPENYFSRKAPLRPRNLLDYADFGQ